MSLGEITVGLTTFPGLETRVGAEQQCCLSRDCLHFTVPVYTRESLADTPLATLYTCHTGWWSLACHTLA